MKILILNFIKKLILELINSFLLFDINFCIKKNCFYSNNTIVGASVQ